MKKLPASQPEPARGGRGRRAPTAGGKKAEAKEGEAHVDAASREADSQLSSDQTNVEIKSRKGSVLQKKK